MKPQRTHKLYQNELSQSDKHNFYRQEIFEDQSFFKLYLLFIALILIAIDKVGDLFVFPQVTAIKNSDSTHHLYYLLGSILTYIISFVIHKNKKDPRIFNIRLFLNFVATCLLATYIVLENVGSILNAIDEGGVVSWDMSLEDYSCSICLTILVSLLMPPWYLRIIVPIGYYFAMIYAYFYSGHVLRYWVLLRLGVNSVIIVLLTLLQTKSRWRLFTRSMEAEGWNQIYQDILSRIPSALGVLNLDGDIIYSNEELKGLLLQRCQDNKQLYQDIVNLRKRQAYMKDLSYLKNKSNRNLQESIVSESYKINIFKEDLLSPVNHRLNLNSSPFELIAESNQFNEEDLKDSFVVEERVGSKFENQREFKNFAELLGVFKAHFEASADLIDETHLTFDGKIQTKGVFDENGNPFSVSYEVRIIPLYEYKKVIIMLNNTTQRDLIASAEENNQYKDRLLASLSHNLRTPLNGNLTFLQGAMNDNCVGFSAKDDLIMPAIRSGTLLLNLINDILDYSLIQSQEFSLSLQYKSLRKTLETAFDLFKNNIAAKDLEYKLEIDPKLPTKFETDHQRLTQIILNLIANAIKFTFQGGITLRANYKSPGKIDISVSDTGIGMTEKEMEDLRKELGNPGIALTNSKKSQGIGLGLRVSDDLVKRLGETFEGIRFESVKGQGSCFSFTVVSSRSAELECNSFALFSEKSQFDAIPGANIIFSKPSLSQIEIETLNDFDRKYNKFPENYSPLKKSSRSILSPKRHKFETLSSASAKPRASQLTNLTSMTQEILIVDDDPMNILGLGLLLNKLNFTTDKAYNGQQAIEKIQEKCSEGGFQYRAIFMDCQMPIMDGYQASKILKKLMRLKKIPAMPIIGCTAFTAKNKLDECIACGMDSVITKPVSLEMLSMILMNE